MRILLVCTVLLFSACFDQPGSAEVTFVNNSELDVENIWGASDEMIALLKPDESVTNTIHWDEGSSIDWLYSFYINGEKYGSWITDVERAKAGEAEAYRFKSSIRIDNGDHILIRVYSEYYWTIRRN